MGKLTWAVKGWFKRGRRQKKCVHSLPLLMGGRKFRNSCRAKPIISLWYKTLASRLQQSETHWNFRNLTFMCMFFSSLCPLWPYSCPYLTTSSKNMYWQDKSQGKTASPTTWRERTTPSCDSGLTEYSYCMPIYLCIWMKSQIAVICVLTRSIYLICLSGFL